MLEASSCLSSASGFRENRGSICGHHFQVSWLKWKNLETTVCTSGLCSCCSMTLCLTPFLVAIGYQWAYMKPRFSQPGNEHNNLCATFSTAGVEMEKVEMVAESMLSGYQQAAQNASRFQISTLRVFNSLGP